MSHLRFTIALISAALLSSCASNQDLVNLDEVDDIYYQSSPNDNGQLAMVSLENNAPDMMGGASDAEKSYYQQTPYDPPAESWESVEEYNSDEDYYDEDYARRLENFHSDEKTPQYIYADDEVYEIVDNTVPQVNLNVGFGYSSFGPGMSMGMGMSWGMGYGNMYSNPYGWGNCYGFNSPFYYQPPYWSPYYYGNFHYSYYGSNYGMGYGMGYANGYNNGYYNGFYDGMYGYGNPYYGGNNDRYGRQVVNEQRPTSTTSTRMNRGGVVSPPSSDGGGRPSGIAQQPTNKQSTVQTASSDQTTRAIGTTTRGTGTEGTTSGRSIRPKSTSNYYSQTANRQTRAAVSPYARSQKYTPTRTTNTTGTTRTTRSNYTPNRTNNTRYSPQNNNTRSRTRSTPSYSPSRSSGGSRGTTTPSSTPSRSSSPTRGGRR